MFKYGLTSFNLLSSDISSDAIEALKQMKKSGIINYEKIYNLIDILKSDGELNEATSLLFELLLKENFNSSVAIRTLSKVNASLCINCHSNQFTQYVVRMDVVQMTTGFGMNSNQTTGDLIVDVCTKCNFCKFMKPPYWS